jgi:hypothetical protein
MAVKTATDTSLGVLEAGKHKKTPNLYIIHSKKYQTYSKIGQKHRFL